MVCDDQRTKPRNLLKRKDTRTAIDSKRQQDTESSVVPICVTHYGPLLELLATGKIPVLPEDEMSGEPRPLTIELDRM